jgi:hypothetical protein
MICVDCRKEFVMSPSEKIRFEELVKSVQGFRMPNRCYDCRKARREMNRTSSPAGLNPIVRAQVPAAPEPAPVEAYKTIVFPPQAAVAREERPLPAPAAPEIRFILATKDFEELVHGRPIVWHGVRVILADIGFSVMREAIDHAEGERAKALFQKNGSQASGETAS